MNEDFSTINEPTFPSLIRKKLCIRFPMFIERRLEALLLEINCLCEFKITRYFAYALSPGVF